MSPASSSEQIARDDVGGGDRRRDGRRACTRARGAVIDRSASTRVLGAVLLEEADQRVEDDDRADRDRVRDLAEECPRPPTAPSSSQMSGLANCAARSRQREVALRARSRSGRPRPGDAAPPRSRDRTAPAFAVLI